MATPFSPLPELRLQDGPVSLRPLREEDAPFLLGWLTDPRVLEWYEGRDQAFPGDRVREDFFTDEPGLRRCAIEYEGRPVGYVQVYPVEGDGFAEYGYPPTREKIFAADQFIGEPDLWGKGVGRAFLSLLLEHLTKEEGAAAVILDPHTDNLRAIRCYESCGFRKKKLLPAHELHEGAWKDCWLMEYRPG